MSEIQFETAQVVALQRYPRNARRRARNQILKIAASIDEFGFTNPILVDEKDEIIAGHGRLEAAIHLKLTTVPVLRVSGLSDVQKKGLRLADNKLGEGSSWDPELLKLELADLTLTDFDVTLTAFETIEIDKWLTPDLGLDSQDRELPPVPAHPVSRLGDLWALGESRLVVGDARNR
ncbi:MAG: ParB N-terminal domain-containing protein, partial [Mesorhizobium sp.]|nr:ParB N-terminal domain-containing protein [Mesorhizobium sp.]